MTARVVAHTVTGDPIIEEHLDGGFVRHFKGDPRHCPVVADHPPHEYNYRYVRFAEHGGLTSGSYACSGEGWHADDPPDPPEVIAVDVAFLPPAGEYGRHPDDPGPKVIHVEGQVPYPALVEFIETHRLEKA